MRTINFLDGPFGNSRLKKKKGSLCHCCCCCCLWLLGDGKKRMSGDGDKSNDIPSLKEGIKIVVKNVNAALAKMEEGNDMMTSNVMSRIRPLSRQLYEARHVVTDIYVKRRDYGPEIIGGSTAAMTLLTVARRGKAPAVVIGTLTGAATYSVVYGLPTIPGINTTRK